MMLRRFFAFLMALIPLATGWIYISCIKSPSDSIADADSSRFWSMGDSLSYVGKEACKNCHYDIYSTYVHTGMGSSFGVADSARSAIPYQWTEAVYDAFSRYYYKPVFAHDRLQLLEFRLSGSDTIYKKLTDIQYIIGSGHHTNSHLIDCNGYLFQAPFTFYTQSSRLDLPPGFEAGNNSRYSRPIGLECMSCHNAMPDGFVIGSENRFEDLPLGIDCERCHGPGSGHISKVLRGELTDTSLMPDYSIVNPKRLSVRLRFELCQRCHLQGNVVLAEGKTFFDFRPGMMLRDVMDVYLPKYENDEHFIMASHADRLSQSTCFKRSKNSLDCTTCHNPHVSSRNQGDHFFNLKCQTCHKTTECKEKSPARAAASDNCVRCHMPISGSIDIPHVTIHDHKIGVHKKLDKGQKKAKIKALVAINNPSPTTRSKINAYLQQYERFEPLKWYLDSALILLRSTDQSQYLREWVHLSYLKEDLHLFRTIYPQVNKSMDSPDYRSITSTNENAWYWYRIAHLTGLTFGIQASIPFYEMSLKLAPHHYEFKIKYAIALAKVGKYNDALTLLLEVDDVIPHLHEVSGNIGYLYLTKKDFANAEKYLLKSLDENPDYAMAYKNLIQVYLESKSFKKLEHLKNRLKQNVPDLYLELLPFLK